MTRDTKPCLTPKLRFPEFRDKPAWEETILGSVLTEHGEKDDGASEVHSVSVHKGVINQVEHLGRSYAAADRSNYNLVKPHDIIYTKSPTGDFPWGIVKQNRLPYNVIVSPLYGVFSPVNRHLGYILYTHFESPIRASNYLAPITQKGAKNTIQISNATFLSKGLYLPNIEAEHKKIAECLSSMEELIVAESQKLDALKAHKKGLLHLIFPRGGETLPRLRFPEFQSAPEWEEKALGQISRLVRGPFGGSLKKDIFVDRGYAVYEQSQAIYGDFSSFRYHITEEKFGDLRRFSVKPNDIIMSCSGTMGKFAVIPEGAASGVINQALLKLTAARCCNPKFLKEVLELPSVQQKLLSQSAGGAIQNVVSVDQIKALPLRLPREDEQEKIVSCISSLDDLIAGQSDKLETLKNHKQGLMQQLFPSLSKADV